jgi:hypothetical protein
MEEQTSITMLKIKETDQEFKSWALLAPKEGPGAQNNLRLGILFLFLSPFSKWLISFRTTDQLKMQKMIKPFSPKTIYILLHSCAIRTVLIK